MLYNLMQKLNKILGDEWKVTYRKDNIYVDGCLEYIVDEKSYEYYKISILADDFQEYNFTMSNQDGQRNVRCYYLNEEQVIDLFIRAVNKDLDLYNY